MSEKERELAAAAAAHEAKRFPRSKIVDLGRKHFMRDAKFDKSKRRQILILTTLFSLPWVTMGNEKPRMVWLKARNSVKQNKIADIQGNPEFPRHFILQISLKWLMVQRIHWCHMKEKGWEILWFYNLTKK
jgi:hypothetical protein